MSEERSFDVVLQDIHERLEALNEVPDENRIREIVGEMQTPLVEELKALYKGRHKLAGDGDGRELAVAGTKYGRFGMSPNDVEYLHDLVEMAYRRGISQQGPSEVLRNLHKEISTREPDPDVAPQGLDGDGARAMDTAESGYGSQLIGVQYATELWTAARERSVLFQMIPTFEMLAPTAYLPVEAAPPEMLLLSESTTYNASNYTTSKTGSNRVLATAKKFGIHQMWSGEMEEDSIIPYIPFLRREAAFSLGHYTDSLVLNGDTTNAATGNINLDDADPDDTKHYLALDGIRHAPLVDNTDNEVNQGAAVTFDALIGMRTLLLDRTYLMDWGHPLDPSDLVYVATPEDADKICLMDEVVTVDKFGSGATVLTGQQGRIGRNPLVSTIAMSLTEADGKVSDTGSNNVKGQVVAVNRRGCVVGWRRRIKIETERLPATDQSRIVYTLRVAFVMFSPTGARSGVECAAVMRNITV